MSANKEYTDMLEFQKNEMTEEESSNAMLLASLIQIWEQCWLIPNVYGTEIEMMTECICIAWYLLTVHHI